MNGRPFACAAVAALLISSPVAAEQTPAAKPAAAKPAAQPSAPTLLASNDVRLGETTKADNAAPAKPHHGRVTSCRCGDIVEPQN